MALTTSNSNNAIILFEEQIEIAVNSNNINYLTSGISQNTDPSTNRAVETDEEVRGP